MSGEEVMVDGRPLSSLKVTELKEELESRELSTKGVKAVLQERLREALSAPVDEENPVVQKYRATQNAALAEAERKRTESETSAGPDASTEASPTKKNLTSSPTKRNTPRRGQKASEPATESEKEPEQESQPEPEAKNEGKKEPEPEPEKQKQNGSADNSPAKEEKVVKKDNVQNPPETKSEDSESSQLVPDAGNDKGKDKEPAVDVPVVERKDEESDELDYGDDEETKDAKDEEEPEEAKEEKEEKKEEKKEGVKKEEKVRGAVDHRRASSPSSRHPVSSIVHIRGLTRPFTERMLREVIEKHGGEIVDFWIDKVKSHCFAKLSSQSAAEKVRENLHDKVWPEGNPKRLAIVFDTEESMTRYKEGRGEIKKPEVIMIGTLTGASRAERLSTASHSSVTGKESLHQTLQNVLRDNDKMETERKEKRGNLASRLTRIEDHKEKVKEEKPSERKRGRSETPPFSKGAGFMDEKKAKRDEKGSRDSGKRDEPRRVVVEEESPPTKTLEQMFKKTVALPAIYYLPLTEKQIAEKEKRKNAASESEKAPEREKATDKSERVDRREDRTERSDRGDHRDDRRGGDRGDRREDRDRARRRD